MLLLGPLTGGALSSVTLTLDPGALGLQGQALASSADVTVALDTGTLGLTGVDLTATGETLIALAPGVLGLTGIDLGEPQIVLLARGALGLRGQVMTGFGPPLEPDVWVGSWVDSEVGRWVPLAVADYRGDTQYVPWKEQEIYDNLVTAITVYDSTGAPPYPVIGPEWAARFLLYLRHYGG